MFYLFILSVGIFLTVPFWLLITWAPKKKVSKPNYCAVVDDKLALWL